jgi:hypothetical protein
MIYNRYGRLLLAVLLCQILFLTGGLALDGERLRYAFSHRWAIRYESEKIKRAVEEFNKYVMDVQAAEGSGRGIDSIPATTAMRHRLFKDAGSLKSAGRVLVFDQASLEIRQVTLKGPVTAEVLTDEAWNYQHKNAATWQAIGQVRGMDGRYRYELVKQEGRWLVQSYLPQREGKPGA